MESIDKDYLNNEIEGFRGSFCPYGYLDIQKAVGDAIAAGHDGDWAFEQIERFSNECDIRFSNIDPCFVVMDAVLQEARCDIEGMSGFDIQNDAYFDVYGNFMCSSWHYDEQDIERLIEVLRENRDSLENLQDATLYFLSEVEIDLGQIRSLGCED